MNTTIENILSLALAANAAINISITPKSWAEDDNPETINTELPVTLKPEPATTPVNVISTTTPVNEMHVGDIMPIILNDDHEIRYRVAAIIDHTAAMVPVEAWPETMPFDTDSNDWETSSLRTWMNTTYHDLLPETITDRIIERSIALAGNDSCRDRIWAPSEEEVYGSAIWGDDVDPDAPRLFATKASRRLLTIDGDKAFWWLRSACSGGSGGACGVDADGSPDNYGVSWSGGSAVPCFLLGDAESQRHGSAVPGLSKAA